MRIFKIVALTTCTLLVAANVMAAPTIKECVKRDVKRLKDKLELDNTQAKAIFEVIKSAFDNCKGSGKDSFKGCMQAQRLDVESGINEVLTAEQQETFAELKAKRNPPKPCLPAKIAKRRSRL